MYTDFNFKTKKELKEAIKNGMLIQVYQPGLGSVPTDGEVSVEGPHYPKAHTWYARVLLQHGAVVKVM